MPEIQPLLAQQSLRYLPGVSHPVLVNPRSPLLRVGFGQATFDAEGTELPGRFFSRRASWPGTAASGVTIGRGYDLGSRTQLQVVRELTMAGVARPEALFLSAGAGLRGEHADRFIANRSDRLPILSLESQQLLFESITTPETIADIKRIFSKPDTVAAYGSVRWDALPQAIQELVFDLRYRGDYTPLVRQTLQPLLAQRDWDGIKTLMSNREYWSARGVPAARIQARERIVSSLNRESIAGADLAG
jgi:hypothetical protein